MDINELIKLNKELSAWKESAMEIMSNTDLPAIGKVIKAPLGADVSKLVLPWIKKAAEALEECGQSFGIGISVDESGNTKQDIIKTILTENEEFELSANACMKYLNKYHDPHTSIIITTSTAEVKQGVKAIQTFEHVND